MNIKTNLYEYVERVGCYNCKHISIDKHHCGMDGVKINLWGVCKKWEEDDDDCEELTTDDKTK